MYVLLCGGPIEGCSAVLAVRRYTVTFGAWVVPSWCTQKKEVQKQNLNFVVVFLGGHLTSRADDTALTVSFQEKDLPSSHIHLAVGTPQCHCYKA